MGFIEAVKICLSKFAKFNGRASKPEFWFFFIFFFIYFFIAGFLLGMMEVSDEVFGLATLVLIIPIFIPSVAVAARRLHDINQSGWIQCIFIPGFIADEFLGTGWLIYINICIAYFLVFSNRHERQK
tara:strand:- start:97 stop:477 length:381 start_codon:yes stop_codon:yes gene_type:complete